VAARNSIVDLDRDPKAIVATREFDAPRALVFEVWTDPKHLSQWWGPTGFTTTTSAFEMKVGGVWRFVMHGPDGTAPVVHEAGFFPACARLLGRRLRWDPVKEVFPGDDEANTYLDCPKRKGYELPEQV
jgi:hypothetical protein